MSTTITRRSVLARTPAVIAAAASVTLPAMASESGADLVALWHEYFPLEEELHILKKQGGAISDSLPEDVRHPRVQYGTYRAVEGGKLLAGQPCYAYCDTEIDKLYGPKPEEKLAAWHEKLKRELAEARRRAEEARERVGLTAIDRQREELCERTGALIGAIQSATAATPTGYAVKILASFLWQDDDQFLADYPHCIAVSALRDMLPHLPDDVAIVASRFVNADRDAKIDDALFPAAAA